MNKDDIQDISSISLDIVNFCGMINANDNNSTKIVAEIKDCASTIIQIIKESNNDR